MENPAANKVTLFVRVSVRDIPIFSFPMDGGHNNSLPGNGLVVLVTSAAVVDENWITDVFGLAGFCGRGGLTRCEKSSRSELFLRNRRIERRDIAFRYWLRRVKQISE
jgi:hypothetical protein